MVSGRETCSNPSMYCMLTRHAYNIQIKEVNQLVTSAICELPLKNKPMLQPNQYFIEFKAVSISNTFLFLVWHHKNYQ